MKYILVLLVVWVGYHLWRKGRMADTAPSKPAQRSPTKPLAMVACAHCGTHLPSTDALQVGGVFYCSAEHRERHVD
ncbi:MAG: PP0621 family protein [Hydrogenophaga sp.]|jgi:uncharacterized protein|nr:PP0621 family protein [Hydrogenophaga sp.]